MTTQGDLDSESRLELLEGFASLKPIPGLAVDAGKKVVKWGKGYAWNLVVYRRDFNGGLTVPELLCRVADSYVATGRTGEATRVLAEAQELMEQHRDVYWEPELLRLSGRLAAAEGAPVEAVTEFERALRLARERGAHLLELRAAVDLVRLQAAQGQPLEARKVLAPVYGLFTEEADAADGAVLAGLDG